MRNSKQREANMNLNFAVGFIWQLPSAFVRHDHHHHRHHHHTGRWKMQARAILCRLPHTLVILSSSCSRPKTASHNLDGDPSIMGL